MESIFKIHVEKLEGEPLTLEFAGVAPSELDLSDEEYRFEQGVDGSLEFKLIIHDVRAKGRIATSATAACVRCLEPVECAIDAAVDQVWLKREEMEDADSDPSRKESMSEYFSGEILDARPTLREIIMAELPPYPKCSADCRGLCPECGVNLNREACRCEAKEEGPSEPDWKRALKSLKKEP